MTTPNEILRDSFERVHGLVPSIVEGLGVDDLLWRPDRGANSIAWLIWHLSRVQDDHLAGVGDLEQAYTAGGWSARFGLPYDEESVGYGHSSADVGAFRLDEVELLTGYHEAVHDLTVRIVDGLDQEGFERIVDDRFDPPVTAAVRLVSVVNDIAQHVGQAGYVRGMLDRR